MRRAGPILLLVAAGVVAAGCGGKSAAPTRSNLRLPSSVAFFTGRTVLDTLDLQPYFAVANEGRDDLTLYNAKTDEVLSAPLLTLRPLAVPFADRPTLLASAPLGDGGADLLVGVSAGSSVLQMVQTWSAANAVDGDPVAGQAVDLGADVLAIVAFPTGITPAGTARLAVVLAGRKLALVQYARVAGGEAIVKDTTYGTSGVLVHGLDFDPVDVAMIAGDPRGPHLYAATLDPIGASAVHGVADVDLSAPAEPWPVTGLDARGPTRLVAGARLQERSATTLATDATAFDGQPVVTRVYAVLDESGCGPQRRIDCGIVTLDPEKTPAAGDDNIPEDWAGWMPYRAPLRTSSPPVALAVSGPPANPPDATYLPMRLYLTSTTAVGTTAVGVVAEQSGVLEFLDLGRFKPATLTSAAVATTASATPSSASSRLWIEVPYTTSFVPSDQGGTYVTHWPGYAQSERWTVAYQGALPGLTFRAAEVGYYAPGQPWLAVQIGDGTPGATGRTLSQVARLYHPAMGVQVGDIVVFKAESFRIGGVQACVGETPPATATDLIASTPKEFETQITQLLPPTAAYPGGAVVLELRTKGPLELATGDAATPQGWTDCWNALVNAIPSPGTGVKGLMVTVDSGGLVLTGAQVGYAGRPQLDTPYALQYKADATSPDEDALAAACPLADWDGTFDPASPPPTCLDATCRATCEELVLARKARRVYNLDENCTTDTGTDSTCDSLYGSLPFPILNGATVGFQVGHQMPEGGTTAQYPLVRNLLTLQLSTSAGTAPLALNPGGPTTNARAILPFDRSPWVPTDGYRFLVTYPGNQVADVSPQFTPVASNVMR